MASSRRTLPQDLAACHALIEEQQATIDRLSVDVVLLRRALFGSRRERFRSDDPDQQYLFESTELLPAESSADPDPDPPPALEPEPEPKADDPAASTRRTSKGRGRRVFPASLPRKEVRHELREGACDWR